MTRPLLIVGALALVATQALAQMPPRSKVATATATASPAAVARGGKGVLTVTVSVAPQFHINANKPNDKDLIPTVVEPVLVSRATNPGVTFGVPRYPAAKAIHVSYEKQPMLVYTGRSVITVPFTVARTARPGPVAIGAIVRYQGCNATSCFPPSSAPVRATVTIR